MYMTCSGTSPILVSYSIPPIHSETAAVEATIPCTDHVHPNYLCTIKLRFARSVYWMNPFRGCFRICTGGGELDCGNVNDSGVQGSRGHVDSTRLLPNSHLHIKYLVRGEGRFS